MNKFVSFCKISIFAFMLGIVGPNISAYEIKHGYTAENGILLVVSVNILKATAFFSSFFSMGNV